MNEQDDKTPLSEDERHQLELYRASSRAGVCTLRNDADLTLLYGNDIFFALHSCTPEELLGKSCFSYIHPADQAYVRSLLDDARERSLKDVEWEMRILAKDGTIRSVLVHDSFRIRAGVSIVDGYLIDISREKDTMQALRLSEEKFRIATNNSDVSFWTYDFATKQIINTPSSQAHHRDEETVSDVPASLIRDGFVRKDSIANFKKMYLSLEAGAKTVSGDFWFQRKDGKGWWCEHIDYTTVFDDAGKPLHAYAVGKDVTATKNAEAKYRDEIAYEKGTQSANLIAKGRANLTQNRFEKYAALAGADLTAPGASYDESIEAVKKACFTSKDLAIVNAKLDRAAVLKAFASGNTADHAIYRRALQDGTMLWVDTTLKAYQNPETGDIMLFIYTHDVTDQTIKESIIEAVTALEYDYISFIDLKNDRYQIFLGGEDIKSLMPVVEETYSRSVRDVNAVIVVPEDRERVIEATLPEGMRMNLKSSRVFSLVCSVIDKNGAIRQKRIQYAYLDKESAQVLMTRTDVTDILAQQKAQQETLETALIAAEQANVAKSDFLSRMSHEIRTPMNAIIGMSAIAADSLDNKDQVADCLSKIGISSRFLLSLINDILDMSKIESGKMLLKNEVIPFEEWLHGVNGVCYPQAQAKGIDYECTVAPNVEDAYIGDPMKLQQILVNIIGNAVKFTPAGGRVSLNVRQVRHVKDNATVRFVINDTGCGISEEFLPHIFEPFSQEQSGSTMSYGGTGLGLAICKNLVDMMNGQIHVQSIVGVGSEFTVDVSLGLSAFSTARNASKTALTSYASLKTLIVDDDVTVCEYTGSLLKEMGVQSEWVDSGHQAIERVRTKWDAEESYDLVLLDWKLTDMDGIETAREIRKIVGPDITIIIMTAYDWAAIETEAKRAGVNLLMSKPLFKSSLMSAFETVFTNKGASPAPEAPITHDFTGKRVLLAEDHPLNVEVATRLLERKGFLVEHAENGLRALELFTTTPVGYYDAILMDIRMPQMDGLQAANHIRHCQKADATTVPIIAMTANAFAEDVEKSKAAGMNAHLAKPIEPAMLYETLARFITSNEPHDHD